MPSDARLGLVIGLTLVILFAVLFVRKEAAQGDPNRKANFAIASPGAVVRTTAPVPGLPGVQGIASPRGTNSGATRWHTVGEGETLMSIARTYYGDGAMVSHLFNANRDRLLAPDRVPEGTVLRIPPSTSGEVRSVGRLDR
jgi:nucleoid-associated protein YgaU